MKAAILIIFCIFCNLQASFAEDYAKLYRSIIAQVHLQNIQRLIETKKDIIGLEVIIASGTNEQIFSKYGHALIRFVNKDNLWANDIMISFVADVDTPTVELTKGMNGGYKITMEALTVHQYWNQYIVQGGRSLSRYIIPATSEQIENVIDQIELRAKNPAIMGGYKFLTKNCASLLTQLFIDSGFSYSLNKTNLPTSIPTWLEESGLNIYPSLVVKSHKDIFDRAVQLLNLSQADFVKGKHWPTNAAQIILTNFSDEEIKILYNEIVLIPSVVYSELVKKANYRNGKSFDQVYGFEKLDQRLYSICQDHQCVQEIKNIESKIWSQKIIVSKQKKLEFILANHSVEGEKKDWDSDIGYYDNTFNIIRIGKDRTQLDSLLLFTN